MKVGECEIMKMFNFFLRIPGMQKLLDLYRKNQKELKSKKNQTILVMVSL